MVEVRPFLDRNFGTEALADGTLPTRVVNVPQGTAITNVIISSAPVWIVLLSWVFNYFAFPVAATIVIPFAFTNEVLANVGNALGMELTSDTAGLVGRPVADSVLTSVVMPATGILFATLTSTTLSTLRKRQQDLRTALRKECTAFETLLMPTRKLFRGDPYRYSRCLCLLLQYTEDVMADTSSLTGRELKSQLFDAERATMLAVLAVIGETDEGLMVSEGPNVSSVQRTIILSRVVGYAQSLCNQINDVRALRRSAFLSAFPTIHWGLLGVLGFTIPSLFIVLASTSKGSTVELLSDELIRCLFASLATSILSLLVLLADLNNPFAGNYRVADGEAFETPRQQIYAALGELESVHGPSMRMEHERLARLVALGPELVANASTALPAI